MVEIAISWIPRIGSEFAGYRVDALLGHGGMSIVYRAEHVLLGRKVALKLLSPQLGEDESFRERFTRESRLAASLDHPNIIPIYEASESDGIFFIAMRYVEGSDLRTILKQGPLEPQRLVTIVDQTANALAAAHARDLVHRDVKPANILVDPGAARGEPDHIYLSDFGVAKQMAAPGLTKAGIFVGTADYASPEQIEGKELDSRADVYALGCVVYECLTGTSAYDKDSEVALMYAHLLEPPPHVSDHRPDLPADVDEVVGKAMAKSKDDRYESPKEFAGALRDVLSRAPAPVPGEPEPGAPATVLAPAAAAAAGATSASGGVAATSAAASPATSAAAPGTAAATTAGAGAPPGAAESAPSEAGGGNGKGPSLLERVDRSVLIAGGIAGALAVALIVTLALLLSGGDEDDDTSASGGTTTTSTSGTTTGSATPADTLLAMVVPTQIASSCTTESVPSSGAVESNVCEPPDDAPTTFPDAVKFDFYASGGALGQAYEGATQGLKQARCGATLGERAWFHPTGKRGGRRACFTDGQGRFVVVWTHEKLGSPDHVDMLGIAREGGRAPTTFESWWGPVNDIIGKCRPRAAENVCLATIRELSR